MELHTQADRFDAIDPATLASALDFTMALVREVDDLLGADGTPESPPAGDPVR